MLNRLLSHDLPRNRWLSLLLIAIVLGLALTPFIFPGTKALNVAAKILVFIVLVASFDLLLGYTGIVSFAHTMFFGIGAYGVAIASTQMGSQVNVLIFIVIIIGGLGSTLGCFVGALLVGLMANYTGFLAPKVAMFSNIALMVGVLLWRPQGLYPVTNR